MSKVKTDIGNGIEIEYELDWSGVATVRWLEGASIHAVDLPGNVCLYLLSNAIDTPSDGDELVHRFTKIEQGFQVLRRQASFLKVGLEQQIKLLAARVEVLENADPNG